jgi:hopene-associated glycosyltransferase HpnB
MFGLRTDAQAMGWSPEAGDQSGPVKGSLPDCAAAQKDARDQNTQAMGPRHSVTAIIPARNEAAVVAQSIRSLAGQSYAGAFRIVLVDDDSTDGTADIARKADVSGRLTIIRAAPLPPGWTGKLWAVSQGVAHAGAPDYLLLTDADIVHPPQNLAELVSRAEHGYDLVSYMAKLKCDSPAERALIPAFVFFFFQLYPPAWIRDPRRKTAGAAGGCILIRREMLEQIGGIGAIRGELIDDCALARAVKRAGGRVWLGLSEGTRSIRDYATFGEIGRMISRTAFTQLRYSALLLAGTVFGLAFVYLLPVALTIAGQPLGALAWLLMSICYWPAPLLPAQSAVGAAAAVDRGVLYDMHGPLRRSILAGRGRALEGACSGWLVRRGCRPGRRMLCR